MNNRDYYVVSPNVWNDGNYLHLLKEMQKKHIVLMGWQKEDGKGAIFNAIKKGDVVLVAKRQNWKFTYYFLGIVESDETTQHWDAQCKKFSFFLNLENNKDDILKNWSTAGSRQIPAIGKIDINSNSEIIKDIDCIIQHAMNIEQIKQYKNILQLKKNLILQGAPGTGKTYNTATLALSICGEPVPDKHEEVMKRYEELWKEGRIGFVTFHQSMDYEDFVEGIKPKTENGAITYDVEDGIFKEISDKARENDDKNHILIIDEINRGNVSKIFGELITLLEADKRIGGAHPIKVTLPYSKEEFGVPSNLYIIGTMNTTDRSVGNIDYAVRRRFAFVTLKADRQILVGKYGEDSKQVQLFDKVSDFLNDDKKHVDMDFDDLMIGHSYFMADDAEELKLKLEYEIIPLIEEYQKDGIINVKKEDLEKEFENWKGIIEA